ncbi:MAG: diguanylate cyclase [Gemmatimonadales bacterium]|nr:diguanylate cyclase [Gemmatimonadales bacterium]
MAEAPFFTEHPAPGAPAALAPAWTRLFRSADDLPPDLAEAGEYLVARVRLAVCVLLWLVPLVSLVTEVSSRERLIALGAIAGATAYAFGNVVALRRGLYRPWWGIASSALDVSVPTAVLVALWLGGEPYGAVNSLVAYPGYFLAISASGLRYDPRASALAGALAAVQYLAVLLLVQGSGALAAADPADLAHYGDFHWGTQVGRLVVLVGAGVITTALVLRTQELRLLSAMDRLTGLYNRGHFDERFAGEMARALRNGAPLSVAMLDLDHFKRFNDTFGHAAGDAVLQALAAVLRRTLRRSDIIARYGGEEFVVALPDTSPEAATEAMQKVRRAVAELAVPTRRGTIAGALTISIGIASFPADGDAAAQVLEEADTRLFAAKAGGRNLVAARGALAGA